MPDDSKVSAGWLPQAVMAKSAKSAKIERRRDIIFFIFFGLGIYGLLLLADCRTNYLIYPGISFIYKDFLFNFKERVFKFFDHVFWDVIIGFYDKFFFLVEGESRRFALVDICEDECAAGLEDTGDFVEYFGEVFCGDVDNDKCRDGDVESVVFQGQSCHVSVDNVDIG